MERRPVQKQCSCNANQGNDECRCKVREAPRKKSHDSSANIAGENNANVKSWDFVNGLMDKWSKARAPATKASAAWSKEKHTAVAESHDRPVPWKESNSPGSKYLPRLWHFKQDKFEADGFKILPSADQRAGGRQQGMYMSVRPEEADASHSSERAAEKKVHDFTKGALEFAQQVFDSDHGWSDSMDDSFHFQASREDERMTAFRNKMLDAIENLRKSNEEFDFSPLDDGPRAKLFVKLLNEVGIFGDQFDENVTEGFMRGGIHTEPFLYHPRKGGDVAEPPSQPVKTKAELLDAKRCERKRAEFKQNVKKWSPEAKKQVWDSFQKDCKSGLLEGPLTWVQARERGDFAPVQRFMLSQEKLSCAASAEGFKCVWKTKNRECENFLDAEINEASSVDAVRLIGPDALVDASLRQAQLLREYGRKPSISLGKADESNAYKNWAAQEPELAAVWAQDPETGIDYIGFSLTLLFGEKPAPHSYVSISMCIAELLRRLLYIPICGYMDDSGFPIAGLDRSATEAVKRFYKILNIPMQPEKVEGPCKQLQFLGLVFDIQEEGDDLELQLSIPAEKVKRMTETMEKAVSNNWIRHKDAESLAGQLSFACQCMSHGRVGRPYLHPLYAVRTDGRIGHRLKRALHWWVKSLKSGCWSRSVRLSAESTAARPTPVILTDAVRTCVAGILCIPDAAGRLEEAFWFAEEIPDTPIDQAETLGQVRALQIFATKLEPFEKVVSFVDNTVAQGSLVKGYTKADRLSDTIEAFWEEAARQHLSVWMERVPSKANWADWPSRGEAVQGAERLFG